MSEHIDARAARESDVSAIADIYNHYVRIGGATFDAASWKDDEVSARIRQPPPSGWFVADDGKAILGWASARRYSLRHGYRFTCETAIYVLPDAVGRGVGSALQLRLEAHCRKHQIHHAVAKIAADNQRSIAFHRRFGYELVGIQKEIGHMNGKWIDVAILQRIF